MASMNDKITGTAGASSRPTVTFLAAQKVVAASTITCDSLVGWETGTAVHFAIYRLNAQNEKIQGSQTDWKGIVSGSTITQLELMAGTDDIYPIGSVVICMPTAAWADELAQGLLNEHNPDGSHHDISTDTITISEDIEFTNNAKVASKDVGHNLSNNYMTWNGSGAGSQMLGTTWQDIPRMTQPIVTLDRASTVRVTGTVRVAQGFDGVTDVLVQVCAIKGADKVYPTYPVGVNYEDTGSTTEKYQYVLTGTGNFQGGNIGVEALFVNLPAGTYTFKVRALNSRTTPVAHFYMINSLLTVHVTRD